MRADNPKNSICVVSKDNDLVSFLTGYSLGKDFLISPVSSVDKLLEDGVSNHCSMIIVDVRPNHSPDTPNACFKVGDIAMRSGIPVMYIHKRSKLPRIPRGSNVYCMEDADIFSALDDYMTKFIASGVIRQSDRRRYERRLNRDRRGMEYAKKSHFYSGVKDRPGQDANTFHIGKFEVNRNRRTVYVDGKNLMLTNTEFKLFMLLMECSNNVCSTEELVEQIWPSDKRAGKPDLYQYMHLLRKKVEDDPCNPKHLLTIKGVGYQFETSESLPRDNTTS